MQNSACSWEVCVALRQIIKSLEKKADEAKDTLTKNKTLYEQVCVRDVSLRASKVPELRRKIEKLFDKIKVKKMELQILVKIVKESTALQNQASEL